MPYEMFKQDKKWCVRNKDTGESKGCSDSRKMAVAHMRALYVHEKKEKSDIDTLIVKALDDFRVAYPEDAKDEDELETKDYGEVYPYSYYYGATSFEELDSIQENQDKANDVNMITSQYGGLLANIVGSPMLEDKEKLDALSALGKEYQARIGVRLSGNDLDETKELDKPSLIERIVSAVKEVVAPKEKTDDEGLLIYKGDNGRYIWIARYSNNFRDEDHPSEIISAASHKRFVENVEKGIQPLPELWLWHVPEWKIGQATWVAYDDSGFALAGGTIDHDKEAVAEVLMKQKDIKVSHGMPPSSIKRDESDPSIIIEHATREISPLPVWAAANKRTGFIVLDESTNKEKQEDDMAIPAQKRDMLIKQWGVNPSLLDALEKANETDAQKAQTEGVESKEKETEGSTAETATETTTTTTATSETAATEKITETPPEKTAQTPPATSDETGEEGHPTRKEVAEAFVGIIDPLIKSTNDALNAMNARMDEVAAQLKELKETDDKKITKEVVGTPTASLLAMFNTKSVVGQKESQVDGRTELGRSHPKETSTAPTQTGIPFLDELMSPKSKQ